MCIHGMHWGLSHILHGIKPRTFESLAICTHDMGFNIATNESMDPLVQDPRKGKENYNGHKGGQEFI